MPELQTQDYESLKTPPINEAAKSPEQEARERYDERARVCSLYLERMNDFARNIQVNPDTGQIDFLSTTPPQDNRPEIIESRSRFQELINRFETKNIKFAQNLLNDHNVLDVKIALGAIIVTFDSQKGLPSVFDNPSVAKSSPRGWHEKPSDDYLGLVVIDINKSLREKEQISPTVTAIHEMQHNNKMIADYLSATDPVSPIKSSIKSGGGAILSDPNYSSTSAIYQDKDSYSVLLERTFTDKDIFSIQLQQCYLDELHSSFMQRKNEWFNASGSVYSGAGSGKHWEIVGSNPADVEATKQLLAYIQGFYIIEGYAKAVQKAIENGAQAGPITLKFVSEASRYFDEAGALIGSSHCVCQAERLVAQKWHQFKTEFRRLFNTGIIDQQISPWEVKTPEGLSAGVSNLKHILLD